MKNRPKMISETMISVIEKLGSVPLCAKDRSAE